MKYNMKMAGWMYACMLAGKSESHIATFHR